MKKNWRPGRYRFPRPSGSEKKNLFYAELYRIDWYIGRLVRYLKKTGAWEDTVLLITSDHGDEFGEHGLTQHGYLYNTCLAVPLIVSHPEIPADRIAGLTSHVDIPRILQALSERRFTDLEQVMEREYVYAEAGGEEPGTDNDLLKRVRSPAKTVQNNQYKLIMRKYAPDELYNIAEDPREQENIIAEHEDVAAAFREKLSAFGEDQGGEVTPADDAVKKRLEHLGYL